MHVATLALDQLAIRPEYQRTLNPSRVRRMTALFDPLLVGQLEVAFDGTSYWVVDGQHRLAVLRNVGATNWEARVHEGLSLADEASLFARLNTERRATTPLNLYRAELLAGTPRATEIDRILGDYGLTVGTHSKSGIQAVSVLYGLHRLGVLDQTIRLITEVWTDAAEQPVDQALDGRVVNAIGRYFAWAQRQPVFELRYLRQALVRHRPDELIREARAYSSFEVGTRTVLTHWYNYRLQPQNRLPE